MKYYIDALKNYANFSGRADRQQYWMFFLFNVIFAIVASILDRVLGLSFHMNGISLGYGWIYLLYALFVLIPGLSAGVRRLHDIDKSGWMLLVVLIPLAGAIWILVLLCTEGTRGANKYGEPRSAVGQ
jgi:uncharacterized membrane protein YhaH (DUF805 family)